MAHIAHNNIQVYESGSSFTKNQRKYESMVEKNLTGFDVGVWMKYGRNWRALVAGGA